MPDYTDKIILDKIVFDDQNVERRSWSCLGQTCSWSLIVFLSQFFVILLIVCCCFWRIQLAKTCEESTVWVKSCAVQQDTFYIHQSYEQVNLYKKTEFLYIWLDRAILAKRTWFLSGWKLEHFNPSLTNFAFSINTLNHAMMSCKK